VTSADPRRGFARRHASTLAGVGFVGFTLAAAAPGGHWTAAIYLLSFWHYGLYWLAYRHGAIAMDVFKRDAMLMKAVALVALGAVYLTLPPDPLSLAVVAAGFLLNAVAAGALGADRTYYGREVAALPPRRVTAFPYSVIAHPMLVGNIAAYAGLLLNADFREHWWPLAGLHIALNLGLLLMEVGVTPRHGVAAGAAVSVTGGLLALAAGAALGALAGAGAGIAPLGATLGAGAAAFALFLYGCYTLPRPAAGALHTEPAP